MQHRFGVVLVGPEYDGGMIHQVTRARRWEFWAVSTIGLSSSFPFERILTMDVPFARKCAEAKPDTWVCLFIKPDEPFPADLAGARVLRANLSADHWSTVRGASFYAGGGHSLVPALDMAMNIADVVELHGFGLPDERFRKTFGDLLVQADVPVAWVPGNRRK